MPIVTTPVSTVEGPLVLFRVLLSAGLGLAILLPPFRRDSTLALEPLIFCKRARDHLAFAFLAAYFNFDFTPGTFMGPVDEGKAMALPRVGPKGPRRDVTDVPPISEDPVSVPRDAPGPVISKPSAIFFHTLSPFCFPEGLAADEFFCQVDEPAVEPTSKGRDRSRPFRVRRASCTDSMRSVSRRAQADGFQPEGFPASRSASKISTIRRLSGVDLKAILSRVFRFSRRWRPYPAPRCS